MLFTLSGKRGVYPQLFKVCPVSSESESESSSSSSSFLGDWDAVEGANECESLPKEILDANPGIMTITKLFDGVKLKE